ncbi:MULTISPECIES: phage late control D family protein [Cysteiniphilum]|uniref:Late control protein D n=1 Tax=Cysteiniphilum litorale TaxID=2056700 RepID=A0A8J3E8Y3_9GAMM|nr:MULTISPECIES: contractile injection system protein, VgrG/Pvc8 family [Cysteiniphilum]GGG02852.1 late control protein D [Cysteiniphilum litorale]
MVIDYQILADNKDITEKIKAALVSLTITDTTGDHADGLSLRLADYTDSLKFPESSAKLNVHLGYKDNLHDFGFFFVDTMSYSYPPSVLSLNANSVPFAASNTYKAMQTQQTRSFDNTTVQGLVEQIAKEHGLESSVTPEIGKITIEHIDQTDEGNIGFLYRVVRQYGGTLKPTHTKLVVLDAKGKNANNEDMPTVTLDLKEISQLSYSSKKEAKFRSVTAKYHDVDTAETKKITMGNGQPEFLLSYTYENETAAKAMAKKVLDGYSLDTDSINITTVGNPAIIAGVPIEIKGLREDIPQEWYVKTATHSLSKQGYQTSAQLTLQSAIE